MLMDTVCGLGVMGGIMVDMGLTLCNYILLHQLTTRLNFIYLFIYNIYMRQPQPSSTTDVQPENGKMSIQNSDHICTFAPAQVYGPW